MLTGRPIASQFGFGQATVYLNHKDYSIMAVSNCYHDKEGLVIILDALGIKEIERRDEAYNTLQNWDEVYVAFKNGIQSQTQTTRSICRSRFLGVEVVDGN